MYGVGQGKGGTYLWNIEPSGVEPALGVKAHRARAHPERRGVRQRDLAGVALGNGAARVQSVNCGIE